MNQSILYWKWEKSVLENNAYRYELKSMMERSSFKYLYISFHHLGIPFNDGDLYRALQDTCMILNGQNRKLLLDIDARNEYALFSRDFKGTESSRICFFEGILDSKGCAVISSDNPQCGRVGRGYEAVAPSRILYAAAFEQSETGKVLDASLCKIIVRVQNSGIFANFYVEGGAENAGKYFVFGAEYGSRLPDVFSPKLYDFYDSMFEFYGNLPLGGVANDEWGHDLMLDYDERLGIFSVRAFPYSEFFENRFKEAYGYSLGDNLLYFTRFVEGREGMTYRVINDYLKLFRQIMRENNDWFYAAGKRWFGEDTFIGVHCTYWGDPYDFGIDILHNGLDWWEVRRDFAQTDEFCIYPIRLAMMHKWNSPYWYNMWYSGNTQQLHTYFQEAWKNVKFGGRTDYLGYECINEPGVFKLKNKGALEQIERMERLISEIDELVKSQPNSSVLIIFGVESASNWMLAYGEPKITRGQGNLPDILKYANGVFGTYNADLVPSSELVNGSVSLEKGKAVYGSQTYEAVILISPEGMERIAAEMLEVYASEGGKLAVTGKCKRFADGEPAEETYEKLIAAAEYYSEEYMTAMQTAELLKKWQVPTNRVPNGCIYRDGTAVIVADAVLPENNYFESSFVLDGKRVEFCGNDYLVLNFSTNVCACGAGSRLWVDGRLRFPKEN